jgi:hypothetical protein
MQKAIDDYNPKSRSDSLVAIEMLILQKSDEQKYNLINSKPDIEKLLAGIGLILTALGGVGKLFYDFTSSRSEKKHGEIIEVLGEMKDELKINKDQHFQFSDGLKIVYDTKAREVVCDALKHISEKHIYFKKQYITPELALLINSQTERLISLSEEIMTDRFTIETLALADVKIEERNRAAWVQVNSLFGCDFLINYKEGQKLAVDKFKSNLRELAESNIINSKYDRYRAYTEIFLHDIIENTLVQYDKFIKK